MHMKTKLTNKYIEKSNWYTLSIFWPFHILFLFLILIADNIVLSKSRKNTIFFYSSHGISILRCLQNDIHAVSPMAYGSHVLVWAVSVYWCCISSSISSKISRHHCFFLTLDILLNSCFAVWIFLCWLVLLLLFPQVN